MRKEINHRVEQDARDAYESLRSQGKLVAATFATQSLGLSLVLSMFAPTPHQLKRKELTPQKTLRRTLSNGDLKNEDDDEGRRLVIVEDTFSDRGGGVARARVVLRRKKMQARTMRGGSGEYGGYVRLRSIRGAQGSGGAPSLVFSRSELSAKPDV